MTDPKWLEEDKANFAAMCEDGDWRGSDITNVVPIVKRAHAHIDELREELREAYGHAFVSREGDAHRVSWGEACRDIRELLDRQEPPKEKQ